MKNSVRILISFLIFELLLLLLSLFKIENLYYTTVKSPIETIALVIIMVTFVFIFAILHKNIRKYTIYQSNITISASIKKNLIYIAATVNIIYFISIDSSIRYIEGGVQNNLILYVSKIAINYLFIIIEIKKRYSKKNTDFKIIPFIFWIITYSLVIDGLAESLTLFSILYILLSKSKYKFIIFLLMPIIIIIGINAKFGENADINKEELGEWIASRLIINTEQTYSSLFDKEHFPNSILDNWMIISDQMKYSASKVFNTNSNSHLYKTFSEFLYYKLYGEYNSGSSPGVFLSGILLGGVFTGWLISYFSIFPLLIFTDSLERKISLTEGIFIYWSLKGSTADFPGVLSILSLAFILYSITIIVAFLKIK